MDYDTITMNVTSGVSSATEMTSCNPADPFFLRPFLTREEFAYWNSRFRRVSSSYTSYVRVTNPNDTTTTTLNEHTTRTTSCTRNATGLPCCNGVRPSGVPALHINGFSHNSCSNPWPRKDPMPWFPEFIPSTTSHELKNVRRRQCPCCINTSVADSANQYDGFVEHPFFCERFVPRSSSTSADGVQSEMGSREGFHQVQGTCQQHCTSDDVNGFYENPSYHERFSPRSDEGFQVKSPSENDRYVQGKCKKDCTGDDVNGFYKNPGSSRQNFVQTGQNQLNSSAYCCDTGKGSDVNQESPLAKPRERIYEQYLYGEKNGFGEDSPLDPSSELEVVHQRPRMYGQYLNEEKNGFGENSSLIMLSDLKEVEEKPRSAVPFDSISGYGLHSELRSRDCFPVKRKGTSPSEHDHYVQGKCKKRFIREDENRFQDSEATPEIKDAHAYQNLKTHQRKLTPISSCCIKDTRYKLNWRLDIHKSRDKTTLLVRDCAEKQLSGFISRTQCIPGSKIPTETESIIKDLSHENCDSKSPDSKSKSTPDQTSNGQNKLLERKDIDEVIKTTKPVQRKLSRTSASHGCAFDHDSMPRLVGVLSTDMATMMSNLTK